MAELEIRQPESNIYSNVEDCEALPLFVRYTSDDAKFCDKDAAISFEDTVAQLSGTHVCSLIHRRQKGRNKVYEELAIKFDELPFCMTAQLARDECTLRAPHFTVKNMVLPEEKDQFVIRKCEVRFVDLYEDSFKLISGAGPYWIGHVNEITQFMKDCFSLPIPPIEIQIEEDKEMWQAYLDGLNALLENKRDLIKIQNISKQKGGLLKLDFDMDSYAQNLNNAITEELKGKCEMEAKVSIDDGECLISFDSYQSIPEDTIESIKTIGRDYCYQADSEPTNTVSGKIAIISDSEELADITSSIDSELTEFGVDLKKDESGEFLLTSDKDIVFLQKIVDTHHKGIAEVVCTTKLIMPLSPSVESVDINSYCKDLPGDTQVIQHGKHFVITSKRPLDTELSIFSKLRFASCMVSVSPKQIDTSIEIEGANIKGNAYTWIVNNPSELPRLGRYFNMVRENYSNQYVSSTFHYAFAPQIEKSVLADLKLQNYGKPSLQVDVPRSCVVFYPKSQEDYATLKDDIFSQLDDAICAEAPEYEPTARIEFLCENEEYRRSVFEKVNVALADKRSNFTTNRLSKDAKELSFAFNFVDIDERDNIETIIEGALASIHGIKIIYEDNNNKGVTQWSLSEDLSLLQELDRKLQSDFRNENVNYINGSKYDKLSEVDEEELAHSQYSKESIIRRRRRQYLQKNSLNIGNCVRRTRDYAIIEPNDDVLELLSSKELKIVAGDYIQFPAMGETMELMRQSKAMSRILKPESKYNHRPINPNLPNYIFDPKYAGETVVDLNTAMEDIRTHKIGNLNEKQLEAVTKSVLAKDLALIQGPPGTGKTTVIAEIIWQEIRKNPDCRILLTSQTNLAVDNALERLQGQAGIRPVRIGKPDKLEPEGRRFSLPVMDSWAQDSKNSDDNATRIWIDRIVNKISNDPKYSSAISSWKTELEAKDKHSRTEFSRLYRSNVNLVAATCSICGSRDFMESYSDMFGGNEHSDMFFDVVIMDEASKATPLEMAVPLVLGKKIIVIGDHKQLPPMMDENTIDSALEKIGKKDIAEKLQKAESQFKRLFEAAAKVRKTIVATLDTQYRMHEQIMNTIKQFYQEELAATGGLKCGITETMDIPDLTNKGSRWHGITLNPIIQPSTHAVWIDVHTPETYLSPGYKNEGELKAIDLVLKALQQADGYSEFVNAQQKPEDKEIGIITFYSAQSREIRKKYKGKNYRMDVVDRFQGMERNIIIVSTVRSNPKNNIGFAKEIERINVAFSRARRLLIVVGNKRQFESNSNYAASIANMETVSFEQLKDAVR
ncbi:AAA domain-containing protein [Bacteroidales bacterium KHT7]|nr:AAA domain-containing protein [Bacteroidales bacterium KHT7]